MNAPVQHPFFTLKIKTQTQTAVVPMAEIKPKTKAPKPTAEDKAVKAYIKFGFSKEQALELIQKAQVTHALNSERATQPRPAPTKCKDCGKEDALDYETRCGNCMESTCDMCGAVGGAIRDDAAGWNYHNITERFGAMFCPDCGDKMLSPERIKHCAKIGECGGYCCETDWVQEWLEENTEWSEERIEKFLGAWDE